MTADRRDRLARERSALLVVDVQDRLAAAMPPEVMAQLIRNTRILITAAARLGVPILVSQQYPRGLGATVAPIEDALRAAAAAGAAIHRWDKLTFSAVAAPELAALAIPRSGARPGWDQWIVCGMECHVCVYQTVRDITGWGGAVHLASDAVASRTKANWRIGLELARGAGAVVSSAETCVFDLLGGAGSEDFKVLSKVIK